MRGLINRILKFFTRNRFVVLWGSGKNSFLIINIDALIFVSAEGLVLPGAEWLVFLTFKNGGFRSFVIEREQVDILLKALPPELKVSREVTDVGPKSLEGVLWN